MSVAIESLSVVKMARKAGCTAGTTCGLVRWLRGRKLPHPTTNPAPRAIIWHPVVGGPALSGSHPRYRRFALWDAPAASIAEQRAEKLYPQRKNWLSATPTVGENGIDCVDNGKYSSRCRYTHWTYRPRYHSCLTLSRSMQTAVLSSDGTVERIIVAPKGLSFGHDARGVYVSRADGTEYHPTAQEWRAKNFATVIRAALTAACAARKAAKKAEAARAAKDRAEKIMESERRRMILAASPVVTVDHAISAGQCMSGIAAFAARMALPPTALTVGIRASELWERAKNSDTDTVARVWRVISLASRDTASTAIVRIAQ